MNRFLHLLVAALFAVVALNAHAALPATCPMISITPTNLPDGDSVNAYTSTVTSANGTAPVTMEITSGVLPNGVDLTDNGDGSATFSGIATQIGTFQFTITATDTNGCSGGRTYAPTFAVASTTTTLALTAGTNPSVFGQSLTFTATVTSTSGTPSGAVTFKDGAATLGTGTLDGGGQATFTTGTLDVGTHAQITAVFIANGSFGGSTSSALSQTVNQAATTTTLDSSVNPSVFGQSVTFTATVAAVAPGAGTPTGTVIFTDGVTTLGTGTLDGSGQATVTTGTLTVGAHSITATYGADTNFGGSTSGPLSQTINQAATTTTVASGTNPSVFGQSVTFTATVTASAPGAGTPTGTVTFLDGASNIGSGVLNGSGQATLTLSSLAVSVHSITASYGADANFSASTSSALNQNVNQAGTTATLISSANPSAVNQAVTFTATVTVTAPGAGAPTGTVTFLDGATTLGTGTLSAGGQATFTTSTLAVGSHSITATYAGDSSFGGSASTPLTQTVSLNASATMLTSSINPTVFGQPTTFTATVTSGAGTPTGTVTFMDGASVLGTGTLAGGVAAFTTGSLAVGTHAAITAVYGGDSNFAASMSGPLSQTVNQASTTTTLASSANPSVFGQSITITATVAAVAPGAGTPTGTVTFKEGATVLASAVTLDAGGQAIFTSGAFAVGAHTITAFYSADTNFLASDDTASPLIQTVAQAATTTALVSATNPSVFGQSVTFTATITASAPGAGTPSGIATFKDGATTLGTGTLAGGIATFTTSSLALGGHTITAVYAGDTNFIGSTSAALTQTVNQAATTTAVASSNNPSVQGQSVTFTATVTATAPGAGTPSGMVTFKDGGTTLGTGTLAGATATFMTTTLTNGSHTITAVYGGDTNFTGSTSSALTQNVNEAPAITSANNATFAPGKTGQTFLVTTTGFPTPGLGVSAAFPANVTFTDNGNGTATIGGTPAAGTQASSPYARTITANNGVNPNATQGFTLNVMCPAITVSGTLPASETLGSAIAPVTFTQSGGNGTIVWSANAALAASGLTINSGSGQVSGTPTATGNFNVTITATDAGGCTGTDSFTFGVAPVANSDSYSNLVDNTQAVVTGGATGSPATPFVSLSGTLIANDQPAGNVAATAGTFATAGGGSVTIATDGTFIYTPKANPGSAAITSDSFTYTVTSNTGGGSPATSAPATVTLTLANRVWYVKNNAAAGGNGQSQAPFNTLAAAGTASTANDILFVYNGDGTNAGQNAGIALKNGQQLLGEVNGLTVNALTLVAVGSRPIIGNSGGDGVTVSASAGNLTAIFIKGLSVGASANAINLNSSGANTLVATVDNVIVANATNNGIKIAGASSGTSTVVVQNSTVSAATQNGIDAQQTVAGNLVLSINNDTVTATGTGINVNGAGSTSTTITNFANNAITGNTGGNGITVTSAIFDAAPGGAFQTISGGTTTIGASGNGVGASGMVLTNVSGDLSFTGLDIFADAGAGLQASGTTPYTGSAGFQIAVGFGVASATAIGGPAISLNTVRAGLQFASISSTNSPTTGIALNAILGTVGATSGSIANASGTSFQVGSSNAGITYGGTINSTNGKGVDLTNNTGSTISFSGTMAMSSGANTTFNATGGGTVTATDTSSTLTSTTGTALNVANTTIGAAGLKFKSITAGTAASGPANGIVLNNTGASGGLAVAGTGSAGSGGTIQKTTGSGVSLTSVGGGASLTDMNISNTAGDGITGATVANFSCNLCNISNPGSSASKHGLRLTQLSGAASLTNVTVTGATQDACFIQNTSTTLTSLTVSGGSFGSSNNAFATAGSGMEVLAVTTGVITSASISGTTFANNFSSGLQSFAQDTATIGDISVSGSTFTNNGSAAVDFDAGTGSPNMKFHFLNNVNLTGNGGPVVNVFSSSTGTGGLIQGRIDGNHVGTAGSVDSGSTGGPGIRVFLQGVAGNITIVNNVIRETACSRGIDVETLGPAPNNGASRSSDVVVTGNDVDNSSSDCSFPEDDIYLGADNQSNNNPVLRAEVHGNKIKAAGAVPANTDYPFDGNTWLYYNFVTAGAVAQLVNFGGHANANAEVAMTQTSGTAGALVPPPNGVALIPGPITTVP